MSRSELASARSQWRKSPWRVRDRCPRCRRRRCAVNCTTEHDGEQWRQCLHCGLRWAVQ